MPIEILMPALSPTMVEGKLSKWLVKAGDTVKSGDVIAEIETDKATMEVEAVDEGTVAKVLVPEGAENVPVNTPIAVLAEEGEDPASIEASAPKPQEKAEKATQPVPEPPPAVRDAAPPPPPRDETAAERPAAPQAPRGDRVFASPLARRLIKEAGLSLDAIKGSGPHGRIVKADVEAAGRAPQAEKPPQAPAAAPKAQPPAGIPFPEGSYEAVPNDGMRKAIARRLLESKQTVPHFYLTIDCEIDKLLALRTQVNEQSPVKVSVNDFVIKAAAAALKRVPAANASWTEAATLRHKNADIGMAVAIEGGLITPIVFKAETKSLSAIAAETKDLAERARNRKLKPEEYQGGTFSISNLGMYGIREFAAIINPPHGAILAVGAGQKRPVVRDDALAVATVMTVTLSCDHRVVDGAVGSEYLAAFKSLIENPLSMLI